MPLALAFSAGIVVDRFAQPEFVGSLLVVGAGLVGCFLFRTQPAGALPMLWLAVAGLGAVNHHGQIVRVAENDIRHYALPGGNPIRIQGRLASQPLALPPNDDQPEARLANEPSTRGLVNVSRVLTHAGEHNVVGVVQVTVLGKPGDDLRAGDEVEIVGRLQTASGPLNPGEFDYAQFLRDRGISALVFVPGGVNGITLLRRGWTGSLWGWIGVVRERGLETFREALPPQQAALAQALVLGEGSGLGSAGWEKFLRTGVIHVLAISGQHLVILAWFLWLLLRLPSWSRRRSALVIALILLTYALVTGGRPPVMRAVWMVFALAVGLLLRRPVNFANAFALAWLIVAGWNPAEIFQTGCQLSFLAVAVLHWGVPDVRFGREAPPIERLLAAQRPLIVSGALALGRFVLLQYLLGFWLWLAVSPLALSRYHILAPIALVIGPPLVLLTSLALFSGFGLLLTHGRVLSAPFAESTRLLLAGCEGLVDWGLQQPGAYVFLADVPNWWLVIFHVGLLLGLTLPLARRVRIGISVLGLGWLSLGTFLALGWFRPLEDRCTFLAVGHGGCVVLESSTGEVALYDVGSKQGNAVTKRQIAPFLWSRGIRRIDEVFLSHADFDHIAGFPELLERFDVKRLAWTPSLPKQETAAVRRVLEALARRDVAVRTLQRGDVGTVGNWSYEVLHPPADGPPENENSRSMVLSVKHTGLTLLLTGDLEKQGLSQVLELPAPTIDVLQAPHHGSETPYTPRFLTWAKPRLAISSQAIAAGKQAPHALFERHGIPLLTTAESGAVTLRPAGERFVVERWK